MKKKILSLFLAVLMVLSMAPVAAFADETDTTAPTLVSVLPAAGAVPLEPNEHFVLTVAASDDTALYELEIDHNMEATLPEFSVYADSANPYGTPEDKAAFEAQGVHVTYAGGVWIIDFGQTLTDVFLARGGITFYLVIKDEAGNAWGSMSPTTPENTFAYTVALDETNIPKLKEGVSPTASATAITGRAYLLSALQAGNIFTDADNTLNYTNYYYERSADNGATWSEKRGFDPAMFGASTMSLAELTPGVYLYRFYAYDGTSYSTDTWTLTLTVVNAEDYIWTVNLYVGFDQFGADNNPTINLYKTVVDGTGTPVTDANGYDTYTGDMIAPVSVAMDAVNQYRVYTYEVHGGWYSYRAFDKNNASLGGMCILLPADTNVDGATAGGTNIYLRVQPVHTQTKKDASTYFDAASYYTVVNCPIMKCTATPGVPYVSGNYTYYPYMMYAGGNACLYNMYVYAKDGYPFEEGFQDWSFGAATNATVAPGYSMNTSKLVTLAPAVTVNITAPNGADVGVYYQYNNFNTKEWPEAAPPVVGESTTVHTYKVAKSSANWTWRASMDGYVTKAGWLSSSAVDLSMTVTFDSADVHSHSFAGLGTTVKTRDEADIYLGSSSTGAVYGIGDSYRTRLYRIWEIINSDTANIMIEPDFNYTVLQGSATVIPAAVSGNASGNWLDIDPDGTAILAFTYDAIDTLGNASHGGFYPALTPERTGVAVFTDAARGTAATNITANGTLTGTTRANINWDYNYDTWYFTDAANTMDFSVTSAGDTAVEYALVTTTADLVSSLSGWSALSPAAGVYSIPLSAGGTVVIRITDESGVSYQCVRVAKAAITVNNLTNPGEDVMAGDSVNVSFKNVYRSVSKISGIFNPTALLIKYTGGTTGDATEYSATLSQYQRLDSISGIAMAIPEDAAAGDYVFTNGYNYIAAMFSNIAPFEIIYGMTDAGVGTNFNAVQVSSPFSRFPDIVVTVYETVTYDVKVDVTDGEEALTGYTLTVTGPSGAAVTPDGEGVYRDLGYGIYTYRAVLSGYAVKNGTFYLGSATASEEIDGIVTKTVVMDEAAANAWDGVTLTAPAIENGVYRIGTGAELAWFAAQVNAGAGASYKAVLTDDIDLAYYNWTPIGTSANAFKGIFNGQGHKIYRFFINYASTATTPPYQALFGNVAGVSTTNTAVVKDLTVEGSVDLASTGSVANAYSGGVVGKATLAELSGITARVDVTVHRTNGSWSYLGGVAGYADNGTKIINCANEGDITGYTYTGGVAGYLANGSTVTGSSNSGTIAGNTYSGGIAGYMPAGTATYGINAITNSYNTGLIQNNAGTAGGITSYITAGNNDYQKNVVAQCFSTGAVTGTTQIGAAIGYVANANVVVSDLFYLEGTYSVGIGSIIGTGNQTATSLSAEELKAESLVRLLNAGAGAKVFNIGGEHPLLAWQGGTPTNMAPTLKAGVEASVSADVTVGSPYSLNLASIFEDGDGDALTYFVKVGDGEFTALDSASYSYTPAGPGAYTLVFKANDGKADSADTYTVALDALPEPITVSASAPVTAMTKIGVAYVLNLNTLFIDHTGAGLTYALAEEYGTHVYITASNLLTFSMPTADTYEVTVIAAKAGDATVTKSHTITITVLPGEQGGDNQYGYNETPKDAVTVIFTLSNDGIPLMGNDNGNTPLSHLEVTVPYFDLGLYDLADYYRYGTDGGEGPYIDDKVIERPTGLHLYLYVIERYYLGLPAEECGVGYDGNSNQVADVLEYASNTDIHYFDGGEAYSSNAYKALTITSSATSLYMSNFWGHDENLMYYRNHVYPLMSAGWGATADYMLLSDGDTIDVAMFSNWSFWMSGAFAAFDEDYYSVPAGSALSFQTVKFGTQSVSEGGADEFLPITDLEVHVYDADWNKLTETALTGSGGNYSYTFPSAGIYYLMAVDPEAGTSNSCYAPATAKVLVGCAHAYIAARNADGSVTYTCSVCGDSYTIDGLPFTVSAGEAEIGSADLTAAADGYAFNNYGVTETYPLYTVTVPAGTDSVEVTFGENVLAYNYSGAYGRANHTAIPTSADLFDLEKYPETGGWYSEWLTGYYSDVYTGGTAATFQIDFDEDGYADYIHVQCPYDVSGDWGTSYTMYVITFVEEEPDVVYGDVNGDGLINSDDAVLILKYAAQLIGENAFAVPAAADVNGDGFINSDDAVLILKYAAQLLTYEELQACHNPGD